jgi:hypothetical protein
MLMQLTFKNLAKNTNKKPQKKIPLRLLILIQIYLFYFESNPSN